MSIWCSFGWLDADGEVDEPGPPIVYRGSHILPGPADPRGGSLDLGCIPGFITRAGRDDGPGDDDDVWPYLRVTLHGSPDEPDTAVLDAAQARFVCDQLTWWLERVDEG